MLNRKLVSLMDGARFYGTTLRVIPFGYVFTDYSSKYGAFCAKCRAFNAYNAGIATGHNTNVESFLDAADDNAYFYCYRLEAEVSDSNHRLRQAESRVDELTAEAAARDAESNVSACTQVTQIPALAIDRSQIALLERRLADDELSHAVLVHQQSVEIDQLTDEIHRLRVVFFLLSFKNKH